MMDMEIKTFFTKSRYCLTIQDMKKYKDEVTYCSKLGESFIKQRPGLAAGSRSLIKVSHEMEYKSEGSKIYMSSANIFFSFVKSNYMF